MDFENRTSFNAALYRGIIRDDRMFGSVVCRITYDLAGTELIVAAEQPWIVTPGPWESPKGPFAGDELFYRGGVDVFVFGSAHAPGGRPTSRVDVTVEVGERFQHTLAVFGERVWEKRNGQLAPSAPKPFTTLPLTLANAFGGADEFDELPIPYQPNPAGKGYAMFEESAPGKSLPNIEHPEHLIRNWNDHPEPYGVGAPPPTFGPRVQRFVEFDLDKGGMLKRIDPKFFNVCFPDMIAPAAKPGDSVRVSGVRLNGPIQFNVPPLPVIAKVWLNDYCHEAAVPVDQIGIDVDALQVFVTYRFPFRYEVVPLEKRVCELVPAANRA